MNSTQEQSHQKRLHLFNTFPSETTRFVDRQRLKNELSYPERIKFKECYISIINVEIDTHIPGTRQYFSVELTANFNLDWINVRVWLTVEELQEILNKSKNVKLSKYIAGIIIRSEVIESVPIREWFKIYLHCKDLDIEVIQARDHEIPKEQMNLYTTKSLIEFLR